MKIAVDFDDTIVLQYAEVLKILNEKYDINIDYNKVGYWCWTQDNFPVVTLEEILDIVYNFKPYDCQPVDKYLTKYFNKLTKEHYVEIVTARWGEDCLEMDIWRTLSKYRLKGFHDIVLSGNGDKQHLNYEVYVDDSPNLAEAFMKSHYGILILYDQPWNWYIECDKHWNLFRAKDWKQVYKIIKKFL